MALAGPAPAPVEKHGRHDGPRSTSLVSSSVPFGCVSSSHVAGPSEFYYARVNPPQRFFVPHETILRRWTSIML